MAQTAKSGTRSSGTKKKTAAKPKTSAAASKSSSAKTRTSKNGSSPRSKQSSNGSAPKAKRTTKSTANSKPKRSSAQSRNGSGSIADQAVGAAKSAGHTVAEAASKAKTPLIAGGTAIAGAAAGLAIKSRVDAKRSKNPFKRIGAKAMPTPKMPGLGKLDLKSVKSTAEKVSAYGQQAADIAAAAEKTSKKNG